MLISNMLYVTLLNIIVNKPLEIIDFESLKQFKLRLINQVKLPSCHLVAGYKRRFYFISISLPSSLEAR